ncbi:unnamed protein product [Arctia plantaginis]|uniref:Chitin-binding type-2 domain-containing protein n=1 Tax=Arctia plantaginis TaxID=874455 RepID=A0A8S0ZY07_ARCPL|nr:unnamed protein product [Arctia plantaginis]
MLRLSIFCMLLALAATQNGYDYNKPDRPFGPTSSRPGYPGSSGGTTTPYPLRTQSNDNGGPTTSYPKGPLNYQDSSKGPGFPSSSYPSQGSVGPLRPSGGPSSPDYSGGPRSSPSGPRNYPSRPGGPSNGSGGPGSYDANYPQGSRGPSGGYPGQGYSSYPQGSRGLSGDQGGTYPGQPGSNFGNVGFTDNTGYYDGGDYSAIPGEPYIDYPILSYIPQTSFNCNAQQYPGYYADVETRCQVFHVCANNKTYDFLCPNGTVFSQEYFVCVWWNQFTCESAPSLYELNAKLYDYSKMGSSDFPVSGFNDYYPGDLRGPQGSSYPGSGNSRPNGNYPSGFRPQGPTTLFPNTGYSGQDRRFPGTQGTFGNRPSSSSPQGPLGSNPNSQRPSEKYPGSQASYPGSQRPLGSYPQTPAGSYPNSQGPSGSFPSSQAPSGGYPGTQDSSGQYPGAPGAPGNYPSSQGPSSSYPSIGGPGSNGSGPQGQSGGPGSSSSRYPSSTTPYPEKGSGSQGYPSGKPNGPSFPGGNGGTQPPTPNREYLPPKN